MKNRILPVLFLICYVLVYSQNTKSIYPNFIGQNLNTIENNSDWNVLQKASGDLNRDGFKDFSLIIESKDSVSEKRCSDCSFLKNRPRIILVFFTVNDSPEVIFQNNKFIARADEGGMANYIEPELSIKNGLLHIYYQYTRSNQSYTFEFKNDRLEIIGSESMGIHSATGNYKNDKFDFRKGILISETGNISKDEKETKIIKFEAKPKSLSEFEETYQWEVIENKYL